MESDKTYFKAVNVEIIRLVALAPPLILWMYIWYNWGGLSDFNASLKEQKRRLTKGFVANKMGLNIGKHWALFNYSLLVFRRAVFTMALLIPFIYTIANFYPLYFRKVGSEGGDTLVKRKASEKKPRRGVCEAPCFRKVKEKKLSDLGIVGTLDLKCKTNSNNCVTNSLQSIIISSNIISLCIFLLVLLIYRQIPSNWDKRKSLNHWVIISLLIGFIIQHLTVWENQHWVTYWASFSASILLSMNIASFMIIISLISTQVLFEFF